MIGGAKRRGVGELHPEEASIKHMEDKLVSAFSHAHKPNHIKELSESFF